MHTAFAALLAVDLEMCSVQRCRAFVAVRLHPFAFGWVTRLWVYASATPSLLGVWDLQLLLTSSPNLNGIQSNCQCTSFLMFRPFGNYRHHVKDQVASSGAAPSVNHLFDQVSPRVFST
jgi:hypothetical protein